MLNLGCAGLRFAALRWPGLGCAGLRWAALGCAALGWAGLRCAGLNIKPGRASWRASSWPWSRSQPRPPQICHVGRSRENVAICSVLARRGNLTNLQTRPPAAGRVRGTDADADANVGADADANSLCLCLFACVPASGPASASALAVAPLSGRVGWLAPQCCCVVRSRENVVICSTLARRSNFTNLQTPFPPLGACWTQAQTRFPAAPPPAHLPARGMFGLAGGQESVRARGHGRGRNRDRRKFVMLAARAKALLFTTFLARRGNLTNLQTPSPAAGRVRGTDADADTNVDADTDADNLCLCLCLRVCLRLGLGLRLRLRSRLCLGVLVG